ncbi:unnamed protein product [Somion occarium]|uniref:F-box domain-containing protein n=1 Tax=Somion occarium TaxID=3059160 RepID=A0ABP1DHI5_9APHY
MYTNMSTLRRAGTSYTPCSTPSSSVRHVSQRNQIHNRHPINKLPAELLMEVFCHYIAICKAQCEYSEDSNPYSWVGITHVCRHWRQAALAYPLLWSTIVPCAPQGRFMTILKRTQDVPLFVECRKNVRFDYPAAMEILKVSNRIKSLALFGDSAGAFWRMVEQNPRIQNMNALHSLHFDAFRPENMNTLLRPTLSRLSLTLSSQTTLIELLCLLSTVPSLTILKLRVPDFRLIRVPSDIRVVILKKLILVWLSGAVDDCRVLLDCLRPSRQVSLVLDSFWPSSNQLLTVWNANALIDSIRLKLYPTAEQGPPDPMTTFSIHYGMHHVCLRGWTTLLSAEKLMSDFHPDTPMVTFRVRTVPAEIEDWVQEMWKQLRLSGLKTLHISRNSDVDNADIWACLRASIRRTFGQCKQLTTLAVRGFRQHELASLLEPVHTEPNGDSKSLRVTGLVFPALTDVYARGIVWPTLGREVPRIERNLLTAIHRRIKFNIRLERMTLHLRTLTNVASVMQ